MAPSLSATQWPPEVSLRRPPRGKGALRGRAPDRGLAARRREAHEHVVEDRGHDEREREALLVEPLPPRRIAETGEVLRRRRVDEARDDRDDRHGDRDEGAPVEPGRV